MSRAVVTWTTGGEAAVESITADEIVLRSSAAAPPGARVEGTVRAPGDPTSVPIRVKVHACRREGASGFALRGRPIDLTREGRERVEAWVRGTTG